MHLIQQVKDRVTVAQAAAHYGLEVRRNRRCLCPFHDDHDPSLLISDDHYHCFACGAHGDVVDFAARLLGLGQYQAAKRLAGDFGIDPRLPATAPILRRPPAPGQAEARFLRTLGEYVRKLEQWKRDYAPKSPEEIPDIRFTEACRCLAPARDYLNTLIEGTGADRIQAVELLEREALTLDCR